MKTFKATKYTEDSIELSDSDNLGELFDTISNAQDFILEWKEGEVNMFEILIAESLAGKVKTGDIKLTAKEVK